MVLSFEVNESVFDLHRFLVVFHEVIFVQRRSHGFNSVLDSIVLFLLLDHFFPTCHVLDLVRSVK